MFMGLSGLGLGVEQLAPRLQLAWMVALLGCPMAGFSCLMVA